MRGKQRLAFYALQLLLLMPLSAAQIFSVTDLGTLGGDYSGATGINERGEVVGYSDIADHSAVHAFVWTRHGGMQDLNPPEITQSLATGINDLGHVVGVATFPVGPDHFQSHAVLWTKQKGIKDLGILGNTSTAFGINDRDQVVGDTNVTGGNTDAAFRWTRAGGIEDLETLGGGGATAQAINNLGHVVGGSFTRDRFHAFSWATSVGMRDLGTLGGCESEATGINDSRSDCGRIVDRLRLQQPACVSLDK